jgi:hypothetical protein
MIAAPRMKWRVPPASFRPKARNAKIIAVVAIPATSDPPMRTAINAF